jgi:hypothetical protein
MSVFDIPVAAALQSCEFTLLPAAMEPLHGVVSPLFGFVMLLRALRGIGAWLFGLLTTG